MLQIEIDGSAQFLAGPLPFTLPTANLLTATCTPSRSLFLIRMHPDVRRDLALLREPERPAATPLATTGSDDVGTRSHETLRSTVRGTSQLAGHAPNYPIQCGVAGAVPLPVSKTERIMVM